MPDKSTFFGYEAIIDGGKCTCQLRGVRPFLSPKYDITKHQRYKYLSDADKKNAFDMEKCLARVRRLKPPVKPAEVFDYYEAVRRRSWRLFSFSGKKPNN